MKEKLISIIKYFRNIFIVLIITSIVVFIISRIFQSELSSTFFYAGVIYMAVGVLSLLRNIGAATDPKYF